MRGLNRVTLLGRLGRDPELRTSAASGKAWASFSLATDRSRREGESWVEETDWHRVKVFGRDAERCGQRLSKGSLALIEGTLTYESWQDKEGVRRTSTVILADRVTFLEARRASSEPVQAQA